MDLKTLSQRVGLSPGTVSRILSGKGDQFRISKTTQERVLRAAKKLGVQPNQLARSLRLKTTRTIGLLIPDISNSFFSELARHIGKQARAAGYSVLLADAEESTAVEAECAKVLYSRRIDGLIVAPVGGEAAHLIQLRAQGLPITQVDRVFASLKATSITTDNTAGVQEAVRHLVQRGRRRIACLQGEPNSSVNIARVRGYKAGLAAAGIPFRADWLVGNSYLPPSDWTEVKQLLETRDRPEAILALGNILALTALRIAQEMELTIPQDLAVVSFDDAPWAPLTMPSLTTIAQPVAELGVRAFQELLVAMARRKSSEAKQIVLPARLIVRHSS